ncbi:MAG: hypothetical protein HYV26_11365 [Candidatus Hydrogenedentes bacterium]|nr:hypothetical protein [Candidatus Hydrogenedentota bacterium]
MRDCLFLTADGAMKRVVSAFLKRERCHQTIGCAPFQFDERQDTVVAAGMNDPGLFKNAHLLLRVFLRSHAHAVVLIDATWDGSPGKEIIQLEIARHLAENGWDPARVSVIAIEPELESWVWITSRHFANCLGFDSVESLIEWATKHQFMIKGSLKPLDPKATVKAALRKHFIPYSSAIYERVVSKASVSGCIDPAFAELQAVLRRWFPLTDPASR